MMFKLEKLPEYFGKRGHQDSHEGYAPHKYLPNFLDDKTYEELRISYPSDELFVPEVVKMGKSDGGQGRPHIRRMMCIYNRNKPSYFDFAKQDITKLPDVWQKFVNELLDPKGEYQEWLRESFNLKDFSIRLDFHRIVNARDVAPHCDNRKKIGSHLMYFMPDGWKEEYGGQTYFYKDKLKKVCDPEAEDFGNHIKIPTLGNGSLLFKNVCNGGWHGVSAISNDVGLHRQTVGVVINYKRPMTIFGPQNSAKYKEGELMVERKKTMFNLDKVPDYFGLPGHQANNGYAPHIHLPNFLDNETYEELRVNYPSDELFVPETVKMGKSDGTQARPHIRRLMCIYGGSRPSYFEFAKQDIENLPECWQKFVKLLLDPKGEYQAWIRESLNLEDFNMRLDFHRIVNSRDVAPHCDNRTKAAAHLMYFMPDGWKEEYGGQTSFYKDKLKAICNPELDDFLEHVEYPTTGNGSVLFKNVCNGGWHGVSEIKVGNPEIHRQSLCVVINHVRGMTIFGPINKDGQLINAPEAHDPEHQFGDRQKMCWRHEGVERKPMAKKELVAKQRNVKIQQTYTGEIVRTIEDNFLSKQEIDAWRLRIKHRDFPWSFQRSVSDPEGQKSHDHFYFVHCLWDNYKALSPHFEFFKGILSHLKVKSLIRMRLIMYVNQGEFITHNLHKDYGYKHQSSLLYLNTCDGYTGFGGEYPGLVESVENRLVTFDGSTEHCSTTVTNKKARLVLGVNYF